MITIALFGELLSFFGVNSPLAFHIRLIPCNHYYDIFVVRVISELGNPLLHLLKRLSGHNFIHYNSSHRITIVDRSNSIIFFLAGCIPNSQFDLPLMIF